MNDAIKNAIQHYIEKNNTLTEDTKKTFYRESIDMWSLVHFCVSCPSPKSTTSNQ